MIGIVLAGGSSKRLSIDKLLYPLRGTPMILRVASTLARVEGVEKVVAVSSPWNASSLEELGLEILIDELLLGPASGIYVALRMFSEIIVVAGDMPFVTSSAIERLVSACPSGFDACLPRWSEGYLEPLCAVYRRGFLKALERGFVEGTLSVQRIVKGCRHLAIPVEAVFRDPRRELTNVNTLEDLAKLGA